MIKTKNAGILEAMEVMKQMSLRKQLRMAYEAHLKAARDRWAQDEYVRDMGRAEGRAEGEKIGEAKGEIRGEIKGKAETVLLILESKGEVPENLRTLVLAEKSTEQLDAWAKQALACADVSEFASALNLQDE